jgi:hypothetical protein
MRQKFVQGVPTSPHVQTAESPNVVVVEEETVLPERDAGLYLVSEVDMDIAIVAFLAVADVITLFHAFLLSRKLSVVGDIALPGLMAIGFLRSWIVNLGLARCR